MTPEPHHHIINQLFRAATASDGEGSQRHTKAPLRTICERAGASERRARMQRNSNQVVTRGAHADSRQGEGSGAY
ncbi:unnamed protein product [Arctogadus glacialis]